MFNKKLKKEIEHMRIQVAGTTQLVIALCRVYQVSPQIIRDRINELEKQSEYLKKLNEELQ